MAATQLVLSHVPVALCRTPGLHAAATSVGAPSPAVTRAAGKCTSLAFDTAATWRAAAYLESQDAQLSPPLNETMKPCIMLQFQGRFVEGMQCCCCRAKKQQHQQQHKLMAAG